MLSLLPAPDLSQPCFVVGLSQFCLNEGREEAGDGGGGEGTKGRRVSLTPLCIALAVVVL